MHVHSWLMYSSGYMQEHTQMSITCLASCCGTCTSSQENHKESTQQPLCAVVGTFLSLMSHDGGSESSSIVESHSREPGVSILIINSTPSSWQRLTAPPRWAREHVASCPPCLPSLTAQAADQFSQCFLFLPRLQGFPDASGI